MQYSADNVINTGIAMLVNPVNIEKISPLGKP